MLNYKFQYGKMSVKDKVWCNLKLSIDKSCDYVPKVWPIKLCKFHLIEYENEDILNIMEFRRVLQNL